MAAVNARLPDKIRKNGVMAIEYLITASPEALNAMQTDFAQQVGVKHDFERLINA